MRKVIGLILVLIIAMVACSPTKTDSKADKVAKQILEDAQNEQIEESKALAELPKNPEPKKEVPKQEPKEESISSKPPLVTKADELPPNTRKIGAPRITEEELEPTDAGRTILNDYFDTYTKDVSGYRFKDADGQILVRGNVYKIILDDQVSRRHMTSMQGNYHALYYFDTVYVNRETEEVTGYCEGHSEETNAQCDSLEIYDEAILLDDDDYQKLLPHDWLIQFLNAKPENIEKNKYSIIRRSVVKLVADGNELYFDPQMGLPIRVDILQNGNLKRYDYEDLSHNTVREVDVTHRSLSEIPSDEIFYSNR